ncbi:MAG: SMC-Scp complex subunit ScpB [Candidatus Omnitrophica bacterium]|nr:SMC-Scp complex subunit ScpB [Candidatus Omnitrophota bacterium]
MQIEKIKSIIESLLFINERPIEMNELKDVLMDINKKEIIEAIERLIFEYTQRKCGICIVKVAGGFQMCSTPDNETWIKRMYQERSKQKLSTACLESLAIISYKQPVTRIEIEAIRGVNVDGVVKKLSDLGLIKIAGRKDVIGKPFLYITTRKFLEYFGIDSIKDLPKLEEFISLAEDKKVVSDNKSQEISCSNDEMDIKLKSKLDVESIDQLDINSTKKITDNNQLVINKEEE